MGYPRVRGARRMTVSNGNAEQPTGPAPRGHNSPNRVEVSEEARQGAAPNAQGQESSNGQSKEVREEQLATTRTLPAALARAAGTSKADPPPGSAARPQ